MGARVMAEKGQEVRGKPVLGDRSKREPDEKMIKDTKHPVMQQEKKTRAKERCD